MSHTLWNGYIIKFFAAMPSNDYGVLASLVVVADDNGKIVLVNSADRGWCIPGGHVEANETPLQAAQREIIEETGLTLEWIEPLGHYTLERDGELKIVMVFLGKAETIRSGAKAQFEIASFERNEVKKVYYEWNEEFEKVFELAFTVLNQR